MVLRVKRWASRFAYSAIFFIFAGVSAAVTITILIRSGDETIVPKLVGMNISEAKNILKNRELKLNVIRREFSEKMPEGSIVSQSIARDERVRTGRSVSVVVSNGPKEKMVPRVMGLGRKAAGIILESSSLVAVDAAFSCSDLPNGTVISQDPMPDENLRQRHVRLLISKGSCRNQFIMPDLTGMNINEVLPQFSLRGFVVRSLRYEERNDIPPRSIIAAYPLAGSVVRPTDPVVFTVSRSKAKGASLKRPMGKGFRYVPILFPPSLFRRSAQLRVKRGEEMASYVIDFRSMPGKNPDLALWLPIGSEIMFMLDGQKIWSKEY